MRSGAYGSGNPALPFTPGSAAVVVSVGTEVDLTPGDRVSTTGTITGAYAELALCKRSQVHRLPACVNYSQGAGVYVPYATAYRALFQLACVRPDETLLVHGACGGVGLGAVQFARAAGMKVIGTAGSDEGLQLVKKEGAHQTVNHRSTDYQKQILDMTNGCGADVILEALASVTLSHDLKVLAYRSRIVVVGRRGNVDSARDHDA